MYFTSLLNGPFRVRNNHAIGYDATELTCQQESGAKEVELHEDDPNAMTALVRYLYDLPYADDTEGWCTRLQPHALVYVVADKYQIESLKTEVCDNMKAIIGDRLNLERSASDRVDFLGAVRTMVSCTRPQDKQG